MPLRMEATNGKAASSGSQKPQPRLPAPSQGMPGAGMGMDDGMPPEMMDLAGMAPEEDDTDAPIPGARRAPDGQWYVDDANRPGKFMRVSA
jgi:hypothetical protein